MGNHQGKVSCCWKWCWWASRGQSSLWSNKPHMPQCSDWGHCAVGDAVFRMRR
uniref:Uncharacterized protein n=1 Tax=Anguilla anguilla TaxID=7936 RepID=A0A0E9W342_ANGAN